MALLPKEPTPPKAELGDYLILLYGPPKIGKTTTANGFPNAVILATEDGQRALECFRVLINSWPKFLATCQELAKGDHGFRTIAIDTIGNLHALCRRFICEQHGIKHESELPYGRGYGLVDDEFVRAITKLSLLPHGLLFIAHSEVEAVETRTGTLHRTVPALPARARRFILGLVDVTLYATLIPDRGPDGKPTMRRVVRARPSDTFEAGDRTGRLPDPVDLNYQSIAAAFAAGNTTQRGERTDD